MKDLKHEYQSTFALWGRVKLNFRDRYRKLNVFLKSLPTHVDLHDPYMVPYTIIHGYYYFPRSTSKIPFLDKISTSGRICRLKK